MNNAALKVIGLAGKMRSGKDTTAQYLIEQHGFTRVAFADPVRELLYGVNPEIIIPVEMRQDGEKAPSHRRLKMIVDLHGWEEAKKIPEVRQLLQRHGEFSRIVLGKSVWVDEANKKAQLILKSGGKVIFTDVRYNNEAAYIRYGLEGRIVRIHRNTGLEPDGHTSESPIDDLLVNVEINNNGTVEHLNKAIEYRLLG